MKPKDISCYLWPNNGISYFCNTGWGEFQLFRFFEFEADTDTDMFCFPEWAKINAKCVTVEIFDHRQASEDEVDTLFTEALNKPVSLGFLSDGYYAPEFQRNDDNPIKGVDDVSLVFIKDMSDD